MAYRSQLVIRTSEAKGAEVLKRVKELADGESKTISDKAIELLAMALNGEVVAPSDDEPELAEEESEVEEEVEESEADEPETARAAEVEALQPPSVKEKDPAIRPDEAPREAAARCVTLFEDEGALAAAQALTEFFAAAEPVDGANIREELQERMSKSDYDALMDELKQTDEYREYRRRVVYASW